MAWLTGIWDYLRENWTGIILAGGSVITGLQFLVRFTPTEKDDGFVTRLGHGYDQLLDFLKIPNVRKKEGTLLQPDGTHEKEPVNMFEDDEDDSDEG